jgi:hypothetical protein
MPETDSSVFGTLLGIGANKGQTPLQKKNSVENQ